MEEGGGGEGGEEGGRRKMDGSEGSDPTSLS